MTDQYGIEKYYKIVIVATADALPNVLQMLFERKHALQQFDQRRTWLTVARL